MPFFGAIRRRIILFTGGMVVAMAFPAFAGDTALSGWRSVTSITPDGSHVSVILDGPKIVPASACDNHFRIDSNDPDASMKLAAITAARNSGKKIDVSYDPATTACSVLIFDFKVQN